MTTMHALTASHPHPLSALLVIGVIARDLIELSVLVWGIKVVRRAIKKRRMPTLTPEEYLLAATCMAPSCQRWAPSGPYCDTHYFGALREQRLRAQIEALRAAHQ